MIKCPDCGEECQFGRITKIGWNLSSIKKEKNKVIISSHFDHREIGGHCESHTIPLKKFMQEIEKWLKA